MIIVWLSQMEFGVMMSQPLDSLRNYVIHFISACDTQICFRQLGCIHVFIVYYGSIVLLLTHARATLL